MLVCLSGALALFFPTSYDGVIYPSMYPSASLLLTLIAIMIGLVNGFSIVGIGIGLIIFMILLGATILSPWSYITFGAIPPYLFFIIVFSLNIKNLSRESMAQVVAIFKLLSVMLQVFALLIILNIDLISNFNSMYYKAISDELFESMIEWSAKPVTVFASHSIAGYMYFAFIVTHIKLLLVERAVMRRIFNAISIAIYMMLLLLLTSNTGFICFFIVLTWMGYKAIITIRRFSLSLFIIIVIVLFAGIAYGIFQSSEIISNWVSSTFGDAGSGLLSRYTAGGRLQPTYNYIIENPFKPIGFTYNKEIALGDNFIGEYILRGGVQLYASILLGLVLFLGRNLKEAKSVFAFLIFFLMGDIGYPLLTYFRTVGLLAMFMVVWNFCSYDCYWTIGSKVGNLKKIICK